MEWLNEDLKKEIKKVFEPRYLRQLSDEYKVDRKVVRKWTKNYGIIPDRKSFKGQP